MTPTEREFFRKSTSAEDSQDGRPKWRRAEYYATAGVLTLVVSLLCWLILGDFIYFIVGGSCALIVGLFGFAVDPNARKDAETADANRRKAALDAAEEKKRQDGSIVCPQCQLKGNVSTTRNRKRKGISGGKAVAFIFTGGLSLPFAGISRMEDVTEATCANCGSKWEF